MKNTLCLLLLLGLHFATFAQNKDFRLIRKYIRDFKRYSLEELNEQNVDSVVVLDLEQENLKRVPAIVFKLKHLQYLDLSENNIKRLPWRMKRLERLKVLFVSEITLEEFREV